MTVEQRRTPVGGRRVLGALGLGAAMSVAVTVLSQVGVFAGWETRAVDAFIYVRDRTSAPEIVVVAIDDQAFRELGHRQPLPRRYLAELAGYFVESGARVVAFDLLMDTPTSPDDDLALVDVVRRAEANGRSRLVFANIAQPQAADGRVRHRLVPAFSADLTALFGFPNVPVDGDGVIRRFSPLLTGVDGRSVPSFGVATLAAYAGVSADELARALGDRGSLPMPARTAHGIGIEPVAVAALDRSRWRIDFAGPPGAITTFPSGAIVGLARAGARPDADNPFHHRIVIVGATFQDSRDVHETPVGLMTGVEIQANIVHTLLGRRAQLPPPAWMNLAVLLTACLGVALLSLRLTSFRLLLAALGVVAALVAASYEAYTRAGYWLDFVAPVAGMLGYLEGARLLGRRRLRAAFGQFVSPELMDRVLRDGAPLGGEMRTVSVLMSDVRGFTRLSEQLPPVRVSEIMNEYFTEMVDVILAHRGLVSDFIGDGILAVFGAPLDDPEHAWHAVQAAAGMQGALARLNQRWREASGPALEIGVAVNSGPVFAGTMGSPRKKKYAVVGDTVNTVARMEGLNRDLGTGIVISAETLAAVRGRVVVRDRGAVMVKGKTVPVEVHELVDLTEEAR